ncbi:MAG: type IV pilus modification protein PilV [Candidatus Competibacteraceae bacterium]|nr:type IV pilus modification protein PilV [Candidatus Competibacteraceae bacterium]
MSKKQHEQFGFTLLEVLVALIILAIGLLGLASFQAIGLRSNHSAQLRTQATILSYDIMDRMRANIRGVRNSHYDNATASNGNCDNFGSGTLPNCDTQDMAAHDLFAWNTALANALASGTGVVCIDSTPEDGTPTSPACDGALNGASTATAQYAVKIFWCDGEDPDDDGIPCEADEFQRFTTSFRPATL